MRKDRTNRIGAGRIIKYCNRLKPVGIWLFNKLRETVVGVFNRLIANRTNKSIADSLAHRCDIVVENKSGELRCHAEPGRGLGGDSIITVRIRGVIRTDQPGRKVSMSLHVVDVTGGDELPVEVYRKGKHIENDNLRRFEYVCDLGLLNKAEVEMSDWLSIAKIKAQWLFPARSGERKLILTGALTYSDTNNVLTNCSCSFDYENTEPGYLDVADNTEQSRALAVTLAFALCAADGHMYKCEIDTIRRWATQYVLIEASRKTQWKLRWAFYKTIRFFKGGNKINAASLAAEIARVAPEAIRYDIVELCLSQVESKGFISPPQLEMLKDIIAWLDIEQEQFRAMLEKLAPGVMSNIKDPQVIFGLSCEMSKEQRREKLNSEYRKWNARVTSADPEIHSHAEQMLTMIAEARSQYVNQA